MIHSECLVCPAVFGGWSVRLSAREAGPYASPEIALRVAIAEALYMQRANKAARIMVRNSKGVVCAEFNLGRNHPAALAQLIEGGIP